MAVASKKNGVAPAPEPTPDPNRTYQVSLFLLVGSWNGDSVYHLELAGAQVQDILAGRLVWLELPESALPVRHPMGETRFINIPNTVAELRVLNWPKASKE